jgi:hypothetical protein
MLCLIGATSRRANSDDIVILKILGLDYLHHAVRGATITYWVRISEQIAQMRVRLASFCIALAAALLRQADVPTPATRKVTYREREGETDVPNQHL